MRRNSSGEVPSRVTKAEGYADQAHFGRDFKQEVGQTPRAFALTRAEFACLVGSCPMSPDAGNAAISASPGGYGPPPGGGPPGGYGPPPGGFGGPPGGGGGFGPPPGAPYGGFGMPPAGGPPGGLGDPAYAAGKVKAPALVMMICTAIGAVLQLLSMLLNILGTGVAAANGNSDQLAQQLTHGVVGAVINVVGILMSAACIFGFLKMMKLQNRGMAYAAVIASMIPCFGSCCYLNIFIGIWALITLADPAVKASFRS